MDTSSAIWALSALTLMGQVFVLASILYALFGKRFPFIEKILTKNSMLFAFIVALVSSIGSLFLSNMANFPPCELCWFQRIFMYPLVIITGIAYFRRDIKARIYAIWLSIPGLAIAAYHYLIQMLLTPSVCPVSGDATCLMKAFTYFGYITIPMMSVTGFAMVLTFLTVYAQER